MRSYFFIPATKLGKLSYIKALGVDEIIIDFEDAILSSDKEKLLPELKSISGGDQLWYRIPVRDNFQDIIDMGFMHKVLGLGVNKIVLPKIKSGDEVRQVLEHTRNWPVKWILLVEHPRLLVELSNVLQDQALEEKIEGIALGSHDLITFLKAVHSPEHLIYPRTKILYLAKAYDKLAIDIASMNVSQRDDFEAELNFGLENGFDAKFLIHPLQHSWLMEYKSNKNSEIEWAREVMANVPLEGTGKEVEPFILNGQIIEKTHVEKAMDILNKNKNEK